MKIADKVGSAERQCNPAMYFRMSMLRYMYKVISSLLPKVDIAYFLIAGTEVGLFCTRNSSAIIPSPLIVKYKATCLHYRAYFFKENCLIIN
jgi:hypothetical protein